MLLCSHGQEARSLFQVRDLAVNGPCKLFAMGLFDHLQRRVAGPRPRIARQDAPNAGRVEASPPVRHALPPK
jgi:hypothetical protein